MREWPDHASPWRRRLHFEDAEFDAMMDDLRRRAGVDAITSREGVDVDRVLLRALEIEADYVNLPHGILGRTCFRPDGTVHIELSRELAEAAAIDSLARRRLRSTLAHECGHVACHRRLFCRDTDTLSLFPAGIVEGEHRHEPILCRHEAIGSLRYQGEWWEYQANRCMASLLLPRGLFSDAVRQLLAQRGVGSFEEEIRRTGGESFVSALAEEYDVSLSMTLFRLEALGFIPQHAQGRLRFHD